MIRNKNYNIFTRDHVYLGSVNEKLLVKKDHSIEDRYINTLQCAMNQVERCGTKKLDKKLYIYPEGKSKAKHRVRLKDIV